MAFFNQFPYSNFHDLNLDWILQTIKSYEGVFVEIKKEWEELWKAIQLMPEQFYEALNNTNKNLIKTQNDLADFKVAVENSFNELEEDVDNKIAQLTALLNTDIITLKSDIKLIYSYVDKLNADQKEYIDRQDGAIVDYVNKKIDEKLVEPVQHIISPFDGFLESVQSFANGVYDVLGFFALNAWEYRNLYWTADEYDKKGMLAYEYDIYAKYLYGKWPWQKESPMLLTAEEYDSLQLTANYFDGYGLQCWQYDERSVWIWGIQKI